METNADGGRRTIVGRFTFSRLSEGGLPELMLVTATGRRLHPIFSEDLHLPAVERRLDVPMRVTTGQQAGLAKDEVVVVDVELAEPAVRATTKAVNPVESLEVKVRRRMAAGTSYGEALKALAAEDPVGTNVALGLVRAETVQEREAAKRRTAFLERVQKFADNQHLDFGAALRELCRRDGAEVDRALRLDGGI